jgi:hypothetical protein
MIKENRLNKFVNWTGIQTNLANGLCSLPGLTQYSTFNNKRIRNIQISNYYNVAEVKQEINSKYWQSHDWDFAVWRIFTFWCLDCQVVLNRGNFKSQHGHKNKKNISSFKFQCFQKVFWKLLLQITRLPLKIIGFECKFSFENWLKLTSLT